MARIPGCSSPCPELWYLLIQEQRDHAINSIRRRVVPSLRLDRKCYTRSGKAQAGGEMNTLVLKGNSNLHSVGSIDLRGTARSIQISPRQHTTSSLHHHFSTCHQSIIYHASVTRILFVTLHLIENGAVPQFTKFVGRRSLHP